MSKTAFDGKTALITGAGSGIGRALSVALAARGARVIATDLSLPTAEATAELCSDSTEPHLLDVRDPDAVGTLIRRMHERYGLDYLFNNAGIAIAGDVRELSLERWNRIIDVNLRGVIHGIHAAYPLMAARGSGHIVNTASLAGLGPMPFFAPYAATKHAVVGLSTSLRAEAAALGVRVSVLCPSAVETPMLDGKDPTDLGSTPWHPEARAFLTRLAAPPYPVERMAEDALNAVARNRSIIVMPSRSLWLWRLGRLLPWLVEQGALDAVADARKTRAKG